MGYRISNLWVSWADALPLRSRKLCDERGHYLVQDCYLSRPFNVYTQGFAFRNLPIYFLAGANCLSRMQELPLGVVCTSQEMPPIPLAMHVEVEHVTCTSLVS